MAPDANSATTPYELVFFEGACGTPIIVGTNCASGNQTGTVGGLISGRTYRVMFASPSPAQTGTFVLSFTSSVPTVTPAQDCNQATILRTGVPISQGGLNMGPGLNTTEVSPQNSCWGGGGERQPKWYKFVAGATGRFTFSINPTDPQTDYDWGIWDITGDPLGCTTKGNAIACNWTGARGATGLSLCPNSELGYQGGDQFDNTTTGRTGANAPITVQAGRIYALLVDNYTTNSTGFTLSFGGPQGGCPGGTGTNVLTTIGLDAEFTYQRTACGVLNFTKLNQVAAGVNVTYLWSFGDGQTSTLANPTHTYSTQSDSVFVSLRVIDALGNPYTFGQNIQVGPPTPAVRRSVQTDLCVGDSVTLTASATGAQTYEWSGPGVATPVANRVVTVKPTVTTTYQLIVARDFCIDTSFHEVRVTPPQTSAGLILAPQGTPPHTTGFDPTTPGANGFAWNFGDGSPISTDSMPTHTYTSTGTYVVTLAVTYGNGCKAEAVEVGKVSVDVVNPGNIITPNGDGRNDVFEARLSGTAQRLQIFNRWGRKVYERDNYINEWNGGDLPAGTYFYRISAADGQAWKGWVELVR